MFDPFRPHLDRVEANRVFCETLRPATSILAAGFLVMAVSYSIRLPGHQRVLPVALALFFAAVVIALRWWIGRHDLSLRWARALAMLLIVLMTINLSVTLSITGKDEESMYLGLVMVGGGMLFLSWTELFVSTLITIAAWLVTMHLANLTIRWDFHPHAMAGCLVMASFAMLTRRAAVARLLQVMQAERDRREHAAQLADTLIVRENEIQQSKSRYRLLAQRSTDMISQHTLEGVYTYVSPACEAICGYKPEELVGRSVYDFIHPDDAARIRPEHRRMSKDGTRHSFSFRLRRRDGGYVWVETSAQAGPAMHAEGYEFIAVTRDITQRIEAEKELRQTRDLLQSLIRGSPVAIVGLDLEGRVLLWNPSAVQLFGYTAEEAVGQFLPTISPDVRDAFLRSFTSDITSEEPVRDRPIRRRHKDGRELELSLYANNVRDGEGRITGMIGMLMDMTEHHRIIRELQQSESHYRAAAESNRRLLSEVNHRVRNNLASLMGLLTLMRRQVRDVAQFGAAMEQRIAAMTHVHNILADANWADLSLSELITRLLASMQRTAPRLAPIRVEGPPVSIIPRQIAPLTMTLAELFTNSCKHGAHCSATGRIDITWTAQPRQNQTWVSLFWREYGGPQIVAEPERSLGMDLIEGFVTFELGGKASLHFTPDGADHHFEFGAPGSSPAPGSAPGSIPESTAATGNPGTET